MKILIGTLGAALLALLLSGCGGHDATAADQQKIEAQLADLTGEIKELKVKLAAASDEQKSDLEQELDQAKRKRKRLTMDLKEIKEQLAELAGEAAEAGKDAAKDAAKDLLDGEK